MSRSATPTESCLDGLNVLTYNFPHIEKEEDKEEMGVPTDIRK